jgi:hypothetical protein
MAPPTVMGNQPPSTIFSELDARKVASTAALHREQPDQNHQRQWQDELVEGGCDQLEAFHGRKHGNGRRDDAVAIEQRRSHNAEQDQNRKPGRVRNPFGGHQGQQR